MLRASCAPTLAAMNEWRSLSLRYVGIGAAFAVAVAALVTALVPCEPYEDPPVAFTIALIVAVGSVLVATVWALAVSWLGPPGERTMRRSPLARSLIAAASVVIALVAAAATWILLGGVFLMRCGA